MTVDEINDRIDQALTNARRLENILILLTTSLFALGMVLLILGFILKTNTAIGFGATIEALLVWPINKIMIIRDKNIQLGIIPALTNTIQDEQEKAKILLKLIDNL